MDFHFSTGDTLELNIMHGPDTGIYRTLVDDVLPHQQYAIYTPLSQGKVLLLQEHERFEVIFSHYDVNTNKYDIYSFQAELVSRSVRDNVAVWIIQRISEYVKKQRRDFFRLNLVKPMIIELEQEAHTKIEALSKDISAGGMRCILAKKLAPKTVVICHLAIIFSKPLSISAEVVSSELMQDSAIKYDTRLRFIGMGKALQAELIKQINRVQAEYLRRTADEETTTRMDEVMAHLDLKKLDQKIKDDRFDIRLGYWMGLEWLLFFVMMALYIGARPVEEYPLDRFFNILIRGGWKSTMLTLNYGVSIALLAVSFIGILIDRTYYGNRRRVKISFVLGCCFALLSLMILTTVFSTLM